VHQRMDLLGVTEMYVEPTWKVIARQIKLGACPQTPLAWHYFFWDQVFYITHDFYVYGLMPLLTTSAHASDWGPAEVFPIGPCTC